MCHMLYVTYHLTNVTDPSPANSQTIRSCSHIMSGAEGGEGAWKMLTLADEGGRGVWIMLKLLIKSPKMSKNLDFY